MRLAWNGATSMRVDLETDIEIARRCGFSHLEIVGAKLRHFLQRKSLSDLTDLFAKSGVKPLSINAVERATFAGAEWEKMERTAREYVQAASELGCEFVVVTPGKRPPGATDGEVKDETISILESIGDMASAREVKVAFEFLGFAASSVRTLDSAWQTVSEIDRPDIGMVIDNFHFHTGGSHMASLRNIDCTKLFLVHISDCENLPAAQLQDAHRMLPGQGVLPVRKFTDELRSIGYDRFVSIEIFRPEYWEAADPFQFAESAKAATQKALGLK